MTLVCAASRFLAMARSLWDWDEALFLLAMRDYDVTVHHPHPPGFPAYIAMAKLVRLFVDSDFRALQLVNLAAAMLLFPAMYLLARELRLRFNTAVIAGALLAFFPNVWFFGGGAFSDIPSIVLALFAAALLLKSGEQAILPVPQSGGQALLPVPQSGGQALLPVPQSGGQALLPVPQSGGQALLPVPPAPRTGRSACPPQYWYWLGTLLLALAIGIRPQNLLLGLLPGILATRKRSIGEIAVALLIGVVVVGVCFGSAIHATGSFEHYLRVVREHGDYISRVDSWRSPERPPLWRLFDRFFIKQYQSPLLSVVISLFVLIAVAVSIRNRNRVMLYNALIFGPFAIFAWLMLDRFSISRFSIGYIPMFALFAAEGIRIVARERVWAEEGLAALFIAAFAIFTLPALNVVRTTIAPSVLAAEAVVKHVDPKRDELYVAHTMSKFVDLIAPGMPYRRVIDDRAMPLSTHASAWLLAEVTETKPEGFLFERTRGTLWNIARRHYFQIVLKPLRERPQFLAGWYGPEAMDIHEWRWMGGRSVMLLPPQSGDKAILRMHLGIPGETVDQHPEVTVKVNGRVVDRFRGDDDGHIERDVRVTPAPPRQPNVLELTIDRTVIPARARTGNDVRTLGLRLRYLAWGPA